MPTANANAQNSVDVACRQLSPSVRKVAFRMARRLPTHVEVDELVSAGSLGLVLAVQQHIDKPFADLKRLALQRVRGAMLDHLRGADPLSRRQRAAATLVVRATKELEKEGKAADPEILAERLGMSLKRTRAICDTLLTVQITPLTAPESVASDCQTPAQELLDKDTKRRLVNALARLPERLRTLLSLYYYEELTYQEMTQVMNVSRSRICQLHNQAIETLRAEVVQQADPE